MSYPWLPSPVHFRLVSVHLRLVSVHLRLVSAQAARKTTWLAREVGERQPPLVAAVEDHLPNAEDGRRVKVVACSNTDTDYNNNKSDESRLASAGGRALRANRRHRPSARVLARPCARLHEQTAVGECTSRRSRAVVQPLPGARFVADL